MVVRVAATADVHAAKLIFLFRAIPSIRLVFSIVSVIPDVLSRRGRFGDLRRGCIS
jgi:hypothetical protein